MTVEVGCLKCKSIERRELKMYGGEGHWDFAPTLEFRLEFCSKCEPLKNRKEFYKKLGIS